MVNGETEVLETPEATEAAQPEVEEDSHLPFPTARVVRMIREELKSGKQIRSEVKEALNIWLGDIVKKLASEMDKTQYGSIGMADFLRATKPYDMIEEIVKDRERILLGLEKLKQDSDQIKRDMNRFFATLTGKEQQEQVQPQQPTQ